MTLKIAINVMNTVQMIFIFVPVAMASYIAQLLVKDGGTMEISCVTALITMLLAMLYDFLRSKISK